MWKKVCARLATVKIIIVNQNITIRILFTLTYRVAKKDTATSKILSEIEKVIFSLI